MTVYFFSDHSWTDQEVLHHYLIASRESQGEEDFKREFESAARGGYQFGEEGPKGWIGPIGGKQVPVP